MSRTAKEIETTGLPCEAQNGETIQVVPKIDVTMFGKFTLKQEGMEVPHAVSLTGRSRRLWTLTAYLILNRNRGVSAQELIDLLWPEAENDNPLSTLQNNVSRARAALAELGFTHAKVIIHNEKGYYRWAPDRETQLDVEQFETLAKAALAEEDMEKSVALAQEAVALYTGDFLTESAAEFWCINLNTYYRSLYTRLCRAAVDRLLKLGRITDAEKLCTGVIRLDPAAEEFSVFLMQALIKNKNPKKALEHYDYIASLYREVYGVSPSAELEAQKALAVQELYGSEASEDDIQTFQESVKNSSVFVGSSRRIISGWPNSARAKSTLTFSVWFRVLMVLYISLLSSPRPCMSFAASVSASQPLSSENSASSSAARLPYSSSKSGFAYSASFSCAISYSLALPCIMVSKMVWSS